MTQASLRHAVIAGLAGLLASSISLALVTPFLRRGFDLYHQGLMLTTAIGVQDGLPIHARAYSQYGPVTAWSQAFAIGFFPDTPAIGLNFWSISLIALTVFVFTLIPLVAPPQWGLTSGVLGVIGVFWATLSPAFMSGELLAWSSLLASLVSVSLIFQIFALNRLRSLLERHRVVLFSLWLLPGITTGIVPFIRINFGIPLVIGLSVWLLLMVLLNGTSLFAFWGFVVGESLAVFAVLTTLYLRGSAAAFVNQSILGPLNWASDDGLSLGKTIEEIIEQVGIFSERSIPLIALSLALVWVGKKVPWTSLKKTAVLFLAVLASAAGWAYATQLHRHGFFWSLSSQETRVLLSEALGNLLWLTLITGGSLGVIAIGLLIATWRKDVEKSLFSMLVIVTTASLIQIWPTLGLWQVWWALPPLLLMIPASLKRLGNSETLILLAPALLLSTVLSTSLLAMEAQTNDGANFQGTLANGLRVTNSTAIYLESTSRLLTSTIGAGEDVFVLTYTGSEAAFHRDFIAANNHYVTWRYDGEVARELVEWRGKVILDVTALDYLEVESFTELEKGLGARIVSCSDDPLPGITFEGGRFNCVLAKK